jgi:gamma-glutamyltranspeptidase/glutathione hydrolase
MQRRTFLKAAGIVAATGGAIGTSASVGRASKSEREPAGGDEQFLKHRNSNRSTVMATSGMACTSQPLATFAALDVLKRGGTAVDAAVAANAMLSLVEPAMCGPGGDLFAIVWSQQDQRLFGLNASGRSPFGWSLRDAHDLGITEIDARSPLAWSVPGCVSGWSALLRRFGRLSLDEVFQPVLEYSRSGFPVSPVIARGWSIDPEQDKFLAPTFLPDGKPIRCGDMFSNQDLGSFYELLLRDGLDSFYQGDIAERIVAFSDQVGGRFSLRDFYQHQADWITPVSASYRGFDLWELPPNGQGIAALQIINMLETFDIASLPANSAQQLHLFLEAKKLAFEDRAVYYADMDHVDVPLEQLISKEYGRERARLIDPRRAAQQVAPGRLRGESETTYLTTADADGNMVSLIQSVYYGWGSRFVPTGLGFCLQNRGKLFALDPEHRNCLAPHKRPFHTIIPAFVTRNGQPVFSFGVMGGDIQPQGHAQVMMNLIDYGMSVQQAGEQPRAVHFESSEPTGKKMVGAGSVGLERGIGADVRQRLTEMGHKIRPGVGVYGGYQGIWRREQPRRYFGGSDPRKDGCAAGF